MFRRLPIRLKLVVLLGVCAAATLAISNTVTLLTTFFAEREASLRVLEQLADVSSENLRAALAFHDEASAEKLLQPLRANRHIRLALVRDENGSLFSHYAAAGMAEEERRDHAGHAARLIASAAAMAPGTAAEDLGLERMLVARRIDFEQRPIGWLVIVSDNDELRDKITRHLVFQTALSLATLAFLLTMSIPLQRLFTQPIHDLLDSMRRVSESKDYALRVRSDRQDEYGKLFEGFNAMLAEIRERDERLNRLATTDPLTGLANRRQALEALDTTVARAVRKGEPVGVIMVDVDFFKAINDAHGHSAGDAVLREVAAVIGGCARNYDLVARIGGEEFLVLCDNADAAATREVAERIRSGAEAQVFRHGEDTLDVTVSVGCCAGIPGAGPDQGQAMIAVADAALYRAKQAGRNRVEMGEMA